MSETGLIETIWQDVKYTLRAMRKNPSFSIAVVLTIALGIGCNTAMFSVIHTVLLMPLAYREPDRVLILSRGATPVRYDEMKAANQSYTELGAYAGSFVEMALSGIGQPEVLHGARITANSLQILGISPLKGHGFLPQDDVSGAPGVVLISFELWQRRFGGDPQIVGKSITLAGEPHTVTGVMPSGFQFPSPKLDVWVNQALDNPSIPVQSRPLSPTLTLFGRLKPSVTIQQANAELAVLTQAYASAHPAMLDAKHDPPDTFLPLKDSIVNDVRAKLWMLFGAVGFVLLIVCANIGSLLLARATSRSREFAVRAAIGAGRGRMIRQLLAESILLATIGGLLGTALAAVGLRILRGMTIADMPRLSEIHMDATVLGFALAISLATGILFGLMPALIAARPNLAGILRGSGEDASSSKSARWFGPRGLLVVGQVALSVVLMIGATLMIESLGRLNKVDPGFQSSGILTMHISLPSTKYGTGNKTAAFFQQLVEKIEAQPGVRSAAISFSTSSRKPRISKYVTRAWSYLTIFFMASGENRIPARDGTHCTPLQIKRMLRRRGAYSIPSCSHPLTPSKAEAPSILYSEQKAKMLDCIPECHMTLILEFHNKGPRGAVWIHYGNIETEVFDGNITIALEVYEHMKRYAMERSGLPDYQYFEDSSETILRLFESRQAA